MARQELILRQDQIESLIFWVRGQQVMLDGDLAQLYGVRTKALNQTVARNRNRFPQDFMFQLSWEESTALRSHFVALKSDVVDRSRSQFVTLKRGDL